MGFAITGLILIITIISVIGFFSKFMTGLRVSGPTLVLREFKIDETASEGPILKIVGRASGIMAWLLTVLKFDSETTLSVSSKEISFRSSNLSGEINRLAPLPSISSTNCGYSKPILFLIFGIVFVVMGILSTVAHIGFLLLGLIVGGIFFFMYSLNKKILISIETKGSSFIGLSFKRSVIENVAVDIEQAKKAIKLVNDMLISSQLK